MPSQSTTTSPGSMPPSPPPPPPPFVIKATYRDTTRTIVFKHQPISQIGAAQKLPPVGDDDDQKQQEDGSEGVTTKVKVVETFYADAAYSPTTVAPMPACLQYRGGESAASSAAAAASAAAATTPALLFPSYKVVQEQLRSVFGLPSSAVVCWWHVYFSPIDNSNNSNNTEGIHHAQECKFRRHICNAEEYAAACAPLRGITTFPRPSLTFQVLLGNDPRLATAAKYHAALAHAERKQQLGKQLELKGSELQEAGEMLEAVAANVADASRANDSIAIGFWSERMLEQRADLLRIGNEMRACEDAKKRHEREFERMFGGGGGSAAIKAIKQKEEKRNEEASKEAERFAKAWMAIHKASSSSSASNKGGAVFANEKQQQQSQKPSVDEAQLAFDFETYLNELDKPVVEATRIRASGDAFPELESIMHSGGGGGGAGSSPSAALPDRLRGLVNDPSLSINGGSTTVASAVKHEIQNVLEGFLVDLGSQFAEFEHGFRERHAARLPSVISGALGQFQQGAARARSQSRTATQQQAAAAAATTTNPVTTTATAEEKQQQMPGAFDVASAQSEAAEGALGDKHKSANGAAPSSAYVHHFKLCDSCDKNPQGFCFKCDTCPDFDLCSACLPRLKDAGFHDASHRFEPIAHPELAKKMLVKDARSTNASTPKKATPAKHNAFCDLCSMMIRGPRFKCLDCPDWDSCEVCYADVANQHAGHAFVRITDPSAHLTVRSSKPKPFHPHISCDGCRKPTHGVRYKCVHPSCPDFDLCEACEAHPNHGGHPIDHHLLKMRFPQVVENHSFFEGASGGALNSTRGRVPVAPRVPAFPPPPPHHPGPFGPRSPPGVHAGHRSFPMGPSVPIPAHPRHPPNTLWGPPPMPRPAPWHPRHHAHPPARAAAAAMPPSYPVATGVHEATRASAQAAQQIAQAVKEEVKAAVTLASEKFEETSTEIPRTSTSVDAAPKSPSSDDAQTRTVKQDKGKAAEIVAKNLSCKFEEDTTIPDGFALAPHSEVMKIWKMRNDGDSVIPADARLVHVDGERFGTGDSKPIGHEVKPGETFYLSLMNVRVPDKVGETVVGRWELVDAQGGQFGDVLFIEISVVAPEERSGLESSSIIMPSHAGSPAAFASKQVSEAGSSSAPTAIAKTAVNSSLSSSSFASIAASAPVAPPTQAPVEGVADELETRSAAPSLSTDNALSESDFEDTFDELSRHSESDFEFISDDDF